MPRFIALRRAVRRVLDGQPSSADPNTQLDRTKGTHDDIETIEQRSTSAEYWTDKLAKPERQDTRAFADDYRLKVTRDKFQDSAIPGCRGRLYYGGRLCLIVVDGKPAHCSKCKALERPWMEDITKNTEGKRFEDVEITGIPLVKAQSECAESSQNGL